MDKEIPTENQLRICIVGPGAIGGVVAGVLAQKGYNIQLVTKHMDLAEKISTTGIEISGHCGRFTQVIPSVATFDQLEGIFDFVLIVTKGQAVEEVARGILPFLNENSRVVSMQNGICEPVLAGIVGEERTVGCVVGWGGTFHGPGKVEMSSGGECVLGNWNREADAALHRLAMIMGHVIEIRKVDNILSELYSKMMINSCITTLGVLSGLYLGELMKIKKVRNIFIEIVREALLVAGAMGVAVAPGAKGKLDFYKFVAHGLLANFRSHLTIRVIGIKYRKLKSSSLQSLERGRKTEINNYNGYISEKGREFGIPTPVNEQLTRMVHEIEEGQRKIGSENLREVYL